MLRTTAGEVMAHWSVTMAASLSRQPTGPVRHSHHVVTATIASSVALFNQPSQTESTRCAAEAASHPLICITEASTIKSVPP